MDRMSSLVVLLSTLAACTAGSGDGSGFPSSPSGPATGKNDAIEDSGSSESESEAGESDDGETSGALDDGEHPSDESTSAPPDADTNDPDPSTGEAGDPETGMDPTGDPGPGQPAMGLWSQCTFDAYDNCTFDAPVCISGAFDGGAEDGFCSRDACNNPAVDCAPVPTDSNATPICVEARDPMDQPVFLCALDCAQGQTCPAGMVCVEGIAFGDDLPIYAFCV